MNKILLVVTSLVLVTASCVKNKGEVTYTYNKAIAQYDNISALRSQDLVEAPKPIQTIGKVFYGSSVVLIGEKNKGIHVINNTNRNLPSKTSFLNLPYCNEFYVDGTILYAETHYDIVKIDISNTANPVLLHRAENAISQPIINAEGKILTGFNYQIIQESFKLNSPEERALRNSQTLYFDFNNNLIPEGNVPPSFASSNIDNKGTMNKMEVADNHLYIITSSLLKSYDVSGNEIIKTDEKNIGTELETIYYEDNKLFIGSQSSMIIANNSNPSSPQVQSTFTHEVSCDPVLPNDNIAYLTLRSVANEGCLGTTNLLKVVDITNPSSPRNINDKQLRSPYGMTISNNHLFIGEGANGITVLDITNPTNPIEISNNPAIQAFDVIKHPNSSDVILTISNNEIKQLRYDNATNTVQELSNLSTL